MRDNSGNTFVAVFAVICLLIGAMFTIASFNHEETATVIVKSVDMQQEIHSDSDGHISTEYHCRVYTDNGMYEVDQSGWLYSHPEVIGQIHNGDTVTIKSRGYNYPQIKMYRKIVEVK